MLRPEADTAKRLRRSRGLALVAVMWLLLLLSVIATATLRDARTETAIVRNGLTVAEARLAADAAVQRAILALFENDAGAGWPRDDTPRLWRFAGAEVRISIHDEAGKIDLNEASPALLRGLFVVGGAEEDTAAALADAVADFRDDNDLRRLNGAEDEDYRLAGYGWGAKDAPFVRIGELQQVFGMHRTLFERIEHALTVHSGRSTIDPASAPRAALLALPEVSPAAVDDFLAERAARSRRADDDADTDGEGDGVVAPLLGSSGFLSADGSGEVFEIRASAQSAGGARFLRRAIVRTTSLRGAPFRIEDWDRGTSPDRAGTL